MCTPVIGAVVGIAQAAVSYGAAMDDYRAKSRQWQENYVNSLAAGRDEHTQLQQRQLQEDRAAAQKRHLSLVEEAEARAEAEVQAADAGRSGISVDYLIADITREGAYNRMIDEENYKMVVSQLNVEQSAVVTKTQGRINSVTRPTAPNPLTFVVGALGAGVRAFT